VIPADAPEGFCLQCLFRAGAAQRGQRAAPSRPLPKRIGDYEILAEAGRGGMGLVYRARQISLERIVALKVIAAGEMASMKDVERFRIEAEAVASLDHPNIVPIYEVGEEEPWHFFSMRLVEGGTLSQLLAKERPSFERTARLLATVARAVHHAHQRGVLHRDLKPGNILLDTAGEPHVTDFGLAKFAQRESDLTLTQAVLGTPAYMSPEQAAGRAKEITTATDTYALGAVLFEMLTGTPPFSGETAIATARNVIDKEAPMPSSINRAVPPELAVVCLKCLEKDPLRRYRSAAALAEDLEHWLRHEPITARRATPLQRAIKWTRRNPGIAALVLLLHVVGALGLAGILWASVRAATNARESHERVLRMYVATGNRLVEEKDAFQGLLYLVEALRLEQGGAVREENHRYRIEAVLRDSPRLEQLLFHGQGIGAVSFSSDGTRLITGSSDHSARVWEVQTGEWLLPLLPHTGSVDAAQFSFDGKRIVTMDSQGVARVWNAISGAAITPAVKADDFDPNPMDEAKRLPVSACFSPDGQRILTAWGSKSAHLWDAASGQHLMALSHDAMVHYAVFSRDGRSVVTCSSDRTARVWDAHTGKMVAAPLRHDRFVAWAQFSPDGKRLLTVSDRTVVHLWDWAGGRELVPPITHGQVLFHASFSPDGTQVLTAGWDMTARIWDAATGLCVARFYHDSGLQGAAWSPDGTRIATACYDGVARVWSANRSDHAIMALPIGAPVLAVAFSPDGRRLAATSWNGSVHVWGLSAEDTLLQTIRQPQVIRAEFSSDGTRVVATSAWDGHCARVWQVTNGAAIGQKLEHTTIVRRASFSRDGQRVLTACDDGTAHLFDIETGKDLVAIPRQPAAVRDVVFAPDERTIITACDDGLARIWELATGKLTGTLAHQKAVTSLAVSPDGSLVATGSRDKTARIWNLATGRPASPLLENRNDVRQVAFSPDGTLLVTACDAPGRDSGAAQVWDVRSGTRVGWPMLHDADVHTAEFSSDGHAVVTASSDRTARVWDAFTGNPVTPPLWHRAAVAHAVFSPDNHRVATISAEGELRLWDARTGEPITPSLPHPHRYDVGRLMFSPGGEHLLLATGADAMFIREFKKNIAPLNDLLLQAQILSAHRIDSEAGVVGLGKLTLSNAWHSLRLKL